MRRRLHITFLSLLTGVLLALEVPLAVTYAEQETQALFIDRLNDAARFASLAEPALQSGETVTLTAELAAYDELFGIGVAVVDRDGRVVVASGTSMPVEQSPTIRRRIQEALAGERTRIARIVWPWVTSPLVVSEPVGRREVIGAVVTVSPTDRLRATITRWWAILCLAGLGALLVSLLASARMTRWLLRPVHDLDDTTRQITAGSLDARVVTAGPVELRHLATSFNTMVDTVLGALEQQRQFVDHASHQLRNPLLALRLRIENLAAADEPEEHRLALEEADRLGDILNGLLALARAERGQHEPERCEVAATVDARLAAWRPVARRQGLTLVRTGATRLEALAVPGVVDQAVDELVGNACKFATGTTVTVRLSSAEGMAELHVSDDGPGLTAEELVSATQRFWRSRSHQNVDGSGLGLSVISVLAEASGGRLDLSAAEPSGLHVCLRLPLAVVGGRDGDLVPRSY